MNITSRLTYSPTDGLFTLEIMKDGMVTETTEYNTLVEAMEDFVETNENLDALVK